MIHDLVNLVIDAIDGMVGDCYHKSDGSYNYYYLIEIGDGNSFKVESYRRRNRNPVETDYHITFLPKKGTAIRESITKDEYDRIKSSFNERQKKDTYKSLEETRIHIKETKRSVKIDDILS